VIETIGYPIGSDGRQSGRKQATVYGVLDTRWNYALIREYKRSVQRPTRTGTRTVTARELAEGLADRLEAESK